LCEERTGASYLLCQLLTPGAHESLLDLLVVLLTHTDGRKRVDGDLPVLETLGELECTLAPGDCLLETACVLAVRGEIGICQRELTARRQVFEQRDGVPRRTLGFRSAARAPKERRKLSERVALLQPVAERPAKFERLLERGDAFAVLVGEPTLARALLEQCRTLGGRQAISEPE